MRALLFISLFFCFSCQHNEPQEAYTIKVGNEIRFEIDSNPTTPYYWEWQNEHNINCVSLKTRVYKNPLFKNKIGVAGVEEWVFVGKKFGSDTLKLNLRTYEEDTTNASVVDSIRIVVRVVK